MKKPKLISKPKSRTFVSFSYAQHIYIARNLNDAIDDLSLKTENSFDSMLLKILQEAKFRKRDINDIKLDVQNSLNNVESIDK